MPKSGGNQRYDLRSTAGYIIVVWDDTDSKTPTKIHEREAMMKSQTGDINKQSPISVCTSRARPSCCSTCNVGISHKGRVVDVISRVSLTE